MTSDIGQLQDLVLAGGDGWHDELEEVSDGMAEAIVAKLTEYISEQTRGSKK